jgi:hypothetical protein
LFNQLTPAEVVTAIGATLRRAARSEGPASDFDRDQLMSAYSATRHLAVELAAYDPPLRAFTDAVVREIRTAASPRLDDELRQLAGEIEAADDPGAVGGALCELFDVLRGDSSDETQRLRSKLHLHLRSLADREVDLLADALG